MDLAELHEIVAKEREGRKPIRIRCCVAAGCLSSNSQLVKQQLMPRLNQFGYGQVESPYGSGQFIKDLRAAFAKNPLLVTSEIKSKDDIMDSIREFLKGGR